MKLRNNDKIKTAPLFVGAVAVFCTLLWGSAFPCIKIGYELFGIIPNDIPSKLIFAGARFLLAGLIVLLCGLFINKGAMKLKRGDILPVGTLGFFQTFLQYLLLYTGLVNISGTRSSILTSVSAFGSVILSAIVFRADRLTAQKLIGCAAGLAGILYMNIGADSSAGFTLAGDGLVILSNLSGAAGNVISKKLSKGRSPVQLSAWQLIFGGSALVISGAVTGGRLNFNGAASVFLLLYLAAMAGIAFMLWTMLLFHNSVSRVAVYNLLIPVFGAMWSAVFLGENIFTLTNLVSLLLVCLGIFIVNYPFGSKPRKPDKKNRGTV